MTTTDPRRNNQLKAIHALRRELALTEECYRALIHRFSNGRTDSSAKMSVPERDLVIKHLRSLGAGAKPPGTARAKHPADSDVARKVRALWLTLWNLGVVPDRSEEALAAFVRRQTKVDALQWLRPQDAYKVIEGLKVRAERDGAVRWEDHINPRICVVLAQWRRLRQVGALTLPARADDDALTGWLQRHATSCRKSVLHLTDAEADKAITGLGRWLRGVIAKQQGQG